MLLPNWIHDITRITGMSDSDEREEYSNTVITMIMEMMLKRFSGKRHTKKACKNMCSGILAIVLDSLFFILNTCPIFSPEALL